MPEELVLLVEKREWSWSGLLCFAFGNRPTYAWHDGKKELAMIVHDPAAHHTPTPSQLETWDAERRQDVALQLARLEQRKAEDWASAAASAAAAVTTATTATPVPQDATLAATIQQKRAEREARRRQLAVAAGTSDAATGPAASGASIPGSEERERDGAAPASNTTTTTNTANNANAVYTVSVPTTSDAFAWYDYDHNNSDNREHDDPDPQQQQPRTAHTHTHTYETLDAARTARVWVYPSSAEERARCEVFRDLWEKGYFMGGGSKFGGDWLVYPGACAPTRTCSQPYHSFTFFHHFSRAHTHRRSAALSFALCCHRATLPICPAAPDGSGGAWSTWHGHEKGASFVWLGPCQPRSHVHQHRMGRIRIGGGFFEKELQCWYITVNDNVKQRELV